MSVKYKNSNMEAFLHGSSITVEYPGKEENGHLFEQHEELSQDSESQTSSERQKWPNQIEFLLSCISMSVGLGNVWRFPVTAYNNGGGAFLIPYLVVLFVIGRPIYFLELTLGQFSSVSQVKAWKLAPFFKGVGYGSMIATIAVMTYYVSIMSLTVFYFFASFQKNLPWDYCDESWGDCNGTISATNQSLPEMYFLKHVVKEAPNIENGLGSPDLTLSLCLLASWVIIFGSLFLGVRSQGKVAWFTAIFPYFVLIVLLIRGLTLDGAWEGIKYFVKPDFEKILEPKVWYAAVSQCFFSLTTGFGSIIMFSSHNNFRYNIYRDSQIVSFTDTFTSILAGFTVFSILGNFAHVLGKPIKDVVQGGGGLAFITYPDAIAKLNWCPQFFAALFFLMLFTLGLGGAVALAGAVITIVCDRYPKAVRWQVTGVVCLFGFAVGIVYTTPGGQFIIDLVDFFGGGFVIYTTSILEVIGIAWIYGVYNYLDDIEFMLNIRLGWYWKLCWGVIIPIFLTIILVYSLIENITPTHSGVAYPTIALVLGWLIAAAALMAFPIGGLHAMSLVPASTWMEKFWGSLKPHASWGPRDPETRTEWKQHKQLCEQLTIMERIKQMKL